MNSAQHTRASDNLRVLVVIDSLLPGGAERSLLSLLPGLIEHKIEPTLVCLKRVPVNLEKQALELGFPPNYLLDGDVGGKWYSKLPIWAWRLRKVVSRERPDLVHSTLFQASLSCRLGLIGKKTPHLSSVVNMDYSPERMKDPNIQGGRTLARLKLRTILGLNRLTSNLVTHFHAVTPTIKDETNKQLGVPNERMSVVFRGRDPAKAISPERRLQVRRSLDIPDDTKLILNVGSQEYQKGQIHLIRAISEDPLKQINARLLIAGRKGAMSGKLENEISKLKLEDKVQLLGHRDDIAELLSAADIFVLPSLFEGAAGALLEAMAAELPIVVSDLPELRGIIHENCALRVPTKSSEGIAIALAQLLSDEVLAKQIAQKGLGLFREKFLLQSVTAEMASLYRKVASTRCF